ncbi:MAG: hypothetical protein GF311_17490 [Candidatus Lokiarchaeota archaeon]|nr:hypothetical protein [Candidatus Lokiarchaeota archaeon]
MTRDWLKIIKKRIEERNSGVFYSEKKYWVKFESLEEDRAIAWIQANKKSLRLFLKLDYNIYNDLNESPCTQNWGKSFPSVYKISSAEQINRAIELILESYFNDLNN